MMTSPLVALSGTKTRPGVFAYGFEGCPQVHMWHYEGMGKNEENEEMVEAEVLGVLAHMLSVVDSDRKSPDHKDMPGGGLPPYSTGLGTENSTLRRLLW